MGGTPARSRVQRAVVPVDRGPSDPGTHDTRLDRRTVHRLRPSWNDPRRAFGAAGRAQGGLQEPTAFGRRRAGDHERVAPG